MPKVESRGGILWLFREEHSLSCSIVQATAQAIVQAPAPPAAEATLSICIAVISPLSSSLGELVHTGHLAGRAGLKELQWTAWLELYTYRTTFFLPPPSLGPLACPGGGDAVGISSRARV